MGESDSTDAIFIPQYSSLEILFTKVLDKTSTFSGKKRLRNRKSLSIECGKYLYSIIFLFLLFTTYSFRIRYSLWYDEAAVVENAKNLDFSDLNKGLNWLQTIPIGYYTLAKFVLQLPMGVEILRFFSMASFLIGTAVAVRKLLPQEATFIHKAVFSFILLLNPISISYATMVKPYAFEFMIGILGFYCFKKKSIFGLTLLSLLAPLFSNTSILILSSIAFVLLFKLRMVKEAISVTCAVSISSLVSLFFTAPGTRDLMQLVWFGYVNGVGPESLKSAVGGLGRLPFSGLGLIPQGNSSVFYPYLSTVLLIILLGFIVKARTDLIWVLSGALSLSFIGHILLIIPAAGRLLLGISALIWIITFIRISELGRKASYFACCIIILFVSTSSVISKAWLNPTGISHMKESISTIDKEKLTGSVYASLWAGPATRFYLGNSNSAFNPNTVWVDADSRLRACQPAVLNESDLIFLDNIPTSTLTQVELLPYLKKLTAIENSAAFEVTQSVALPAIINPEDHVSCMYHSSNPQFPIKD